MLRRFHFHRFEFKYSLSLKQAEHIYRELLLHMNPDPFALELGRDRYRVTSLYFDTPDFRMYHEKLDGIKTRRKLRLRVYNIDLNQPDVVYLELKRRNNNTIIKDRFYVDANRMQSDYIKPLMEIMSNEQIPKHRKDVVEEFLFHVYRFRMMPKIAVTYDRKPLVSKVSKNIRITFDREIRAKATENLFDVDQGRFAFPNRVVMEVKFSGTLPWWVHHIFQVHNLCHESISKYCLGVDTSDHRYERGGVALL
jgi:hypothetical protein